MCLFSFIVNMDEERMSRSLCKFFQRVERFHVTRRKIINEKKMNDAQTPCGKFIYIALQSFFSIFFHSRTRATLNNHSFFKLLKIKNAQFV